MSVIDRFKAKTVDSIVSTFHKTIADLETLSESHKGKMIENNLKISYLNLQNSNLSSEKDRADEISKKIRALVE